MAELVTLSPEDMLMPVHFMPCGHVSNMRRSNIVEELDKLPESSLLTQLAGSDQLGDIDAGIKLDAVNLPSISCVDCEYDREQRDRRYAELDW